MKSLDADRLKIARVLLNLSHSYLHSTSLENSEDEEGEGEEEEEENRKKEKKEEKIQQYLSKNNLEEFIEEQEQPTNQIQHGVYEKMEVQSGDKLKVDEENQFEFDNESNVNIQQKFDFDLSKQHNNKEHLQYRFDNEKVQILNDQKVLNKFGREIQQKTELDNGTGLNVEMEVDSEFRQDLNKKPQEKLTTKQPISESYVEIQLSIEVDSDFEHDLGENVQKFDNETQLSDTDIEIKLDIEVQGNSEFQQVTDKNISEELDIPKKLKDNIVQQLKQKIEKKSNSNFECSNNCKAVEDIEQHKFDKETHVYSECNSFEQNVGRKTQKEFEGIEYNTKREVLEEFNDKKQSMEQHFDNKLQISPDISLKFIRETHKDLEEKLQKQCGVQQKEFGEEKVQNYFLNKKRDVKNEFNKEVDSEFQLKLVDHINKKQNKVKDEMQGIFNKQLKHVISKNTQVVDNNLQNTFDNENIKYLKTKSQEIKSVILNKINSRSKEFVINDQLGSNENGRVQCNRNLEKEGNDNTRAKLENEIYVLELNLEAYKKKIANIIQKGIQQKIDELVSKLLYEEQSLDKELEHNLTGELQEDSIIQIQHQIDKLQRKIEKFDEDEYKKLEKNIFKKIDKTYNHSIQIKLLENLLFLLNEESSTIYDRVENLYDKYFKELDNSMETNVKEVTEQILNKEVIQKLNKMFQKVNDEVNQQVFDELQHKIDRNITYEIKEKLLINFDKKNNEKIKDIFQEGVIKIQENNEDIVENDMLQNFDLFIHFNREDEQKIDNETQQMVKSKVQVKYNENMIEKFRKNDFVCNNTQQSYDHETALQFKCSSVNDKVDKKNVQQHNKQVWQNDCRKECNKFNEKSKQTIEKNMQVEFYKIVEEFNKKMEIDFNEENQTNINEQLKHLDKNIKEEIQKEGYKEIYLQLEFFRETQVQVDVPKNELQYEIDIETFKKELLNKPRNINESDEKVENELQKTEPQNKMDESSKEFEESDVDMEEFEDEIQNSTIEHFVGYIQENFKDKLQGEFNVNNGKFVEVSEESDVDIEGFEDNVQYNFKKEIQDALYINNSELENESEESDVDIERFEDEKQNDFKTFQGSKTEIELTEDCMQANFTESKVFIDKLKQIQSQSNETFQQNINEKSLEKHDKELLLRNNELSKFEELNIFKEVNEVLELAEEYEVESPLSVNNFAHVDQECPFIEKSLSSKECFFSDECSLLEESLIRKKSLVGLSKKKHLIDSPEQSSLEGFLPKISSYFMKSPLDEFSNSEKLNSTEKLNFISVQLSSSEEEFSSSEADCSFTEKVFDSEEEEYSSTEDIFDFEEKECSSTYHEEDFNDMVQQHLDKEGLLNFNRSTYESEKKFKKLKLGVQDIENEINKEISLDSDDEIQQELYTKSLQEFQRNAQQTVERRFKLKDKDLLNVEDLELSMKMDGVHDLDEMPLELNEQQEEKFEDDLYQQLTEFQKEFYKDLRQKYDQELQLKAKYGFKSISSDDFNQQQQTFYNLKDDFHEMKQEYKNFVQQHFFKELQQEVNEKVLLEMEQFPEQFDDIKNKIDEDIHKEFVELERDCYKLEPEFKYNVPLEIEESNLNQSVESKPFNLFKKLNLIHKKKLCKFVDSKWWPENCLYPSSLLDSLFDDPLEVKPNVLIITLYAIDVGYSIKITINKNEPPVETFYNYAEDSILEYVEREELPPHILDILDKAEPSLFYNGCIIAEIHDQLNGVAGELYRILLRPSNISILSDINQIVAENSQINWTYKMKLKLESKLLLLSKPAMCMDSSPIAGLTVNLQHQLLSGRTIILNPLKKKYTFSSKLISSPIDSSNNSAGNILSTSMLSDELPCKSSELMDTGSDKIIYHILWKFDFRLKSVKIIELYVLIVTHIQEYSMLLCMNSNAESATKIRFKINLNSNNLKTYISVILDILKEKIGSDMLVVRRYRNDDISQARLITSVPTLFSDNVYEPSHVNFNQLIMKLLENNFGYQYYQTDFEIKKNESLVVPIQLSSDTQNIDEPNKSSRINTMMDETIKKNINFCTTKQLLKTSKKDFELLNEHLTKKQPYESITFLKKTKEVELPTINPTSNSPPTDPVAVDSPSLKCSSIDMNISLKFDLMEELPIESSTSDINLYADASSTSSIMEVSLSGDGSYEDKFTTIDEEELDSVSAAEILLLNETSSIACPISIVSSAPSPINIMPLVLSPMHTVPLVSNSVISSVLNNVVSSMAVISSDSKPITVISSLPRPITVMSSVPSNIKLVSSSPPNVSSSEMFNTDCKQTSIHLLTLKHHSTSIDNKLKRDMFSKTEDLKYLKINGESAINSFDKGKLKPQTLEDMKTACGTLYTKPLNSQCLEKISVVKHMHKNGICLNGPKNLFINKKISQIASLKPKTSIQQTTTNNQLDRRKKTDECNTLRTNATSSTSLQVITDSTHTLSNDSFITDQTMNSRNSCVIKSTSSNNLTNASLFKEIKNTSSSNIDDYKSVKRKRTTS